MPAARRGWLPLLAGIAVASAVRSAAGVGAVLKWPNDVLVGERKLAGILAEQSPDGSAVVIGTGLNVATPADALPVSATGLPATSLLAEGAAVSREDAAARDARPSLSTGTLAFRADPDPVRAGVLDAYRALCATLGQDGPGRAAGRAALLTGDGQGHRRRRPPAGSGNCRRRGHASVGGGRGPRPVAT